MIATILTSTAVGMSLGAAFALLKLPIPAPITFAGVMGVVGVWMGFAIITKLFG